MSTKSSKGGGKQAPRAEKTGAPPRREKALILIVDDVADNRDIYADFLRFSGYDVIEAKDGFEAVEIAQAQIPDLVLMDLSLPGMDGWDATRKIKASSKTSHVKVIAVTGHALEGTSKGARDAGCDGFLAKPCLPDELEKEIRRMLEPDKAAPSRSASTKGSSPRES
jgi:two-component system, cell cycle response regulator DivK